MWIWIAVAAALFAALFAFALSAAVVRVRVRVAGARLTARFDMRLLWGLAGKTVQLPRLTPASLRHLIDRRRARARSRRATSAANRRKAKLGAGHPGRWVGWVNSFPRALVRTLAGRVVVRRLRLSGAVGTGDAATTAVAYGGAWAALGCLLGASHHYVRFDIDPEIRFVPDFSHRRLRLRCDCILSIRVADIMLAAIAVGAARLRGLRGRA